MLRFVLCTLIAHATSGQNADYRRTFARILPVATSHRRILPKTAIKEHGTTHRQSAILTILIS